MRYILLTFITLLLAECAQAADNISEKVYKITAYSSGSKTLSVKNSSIDNRAAVVTWTETAVNAQRWRATSDETGNYCYLTNVYTEKVLHITGNPPSGAKVDQYKNDFSKYCKWEISPADGYPDGFYITSATLAAGEKCFLEVSGSDEGAGVKLSLKKESDDADRQVWKMEAVEEEPNRFTADIRDNIMKDWKAYYYKKASTGYVLGPGGWWGDAEMFETVLDAYETTGDREHKEMFVQLYNNFISRNGSDWTNNEYNDDIAWMVIACARAYLMFGDTPYLNRAKTNFDKMYSRALLSTGMLRWKETPKNNMGTNSCINGPAEVAACYLAMATGEDGYYEKAKNLYALQRQYLYVPATGQVYDSFTWKDGVPSDYNHWASTYNQGTFLGAALMLYNRYGDIQYKEDAQKITDYVRRYLCNSQGVISVCGSGDDLAGFKGILMRYLRRFIVDLALPDRVDWLQTNVLHAYNNRNSKGICWTAWWEKTAENFVFGDYNYRNKPFGSSTVVSAAFNTPLDKNLIVKDGFSVIEAENFNYLKGLFTESAAEADAPVYLENIKDGYWTAYSNVDFGDRQAQNIEFRIADAENEGTIEIRTGGVSGNLIGTAVIPLTEDWNGWTTIRCDIEPVGGVQNIYLVFRGNGNLFKLDYLKFGDGETALPEKPQPEAGVKIYPNPAGDFIRIDGSGRRKISVFAMDGKRMFAGITRPGITSIDVSKYAKGVYMLKINADEVVINQRFIKN